MSVRLRPQILCATVPVEGTVALHVFEARALQAHYTQCPRSVHTPYTYLTCTLHADRVTLDIKAATLVEQPV